jgi:hypothetical protein
MASSAGGIRMLDGTTGDLEIEALSIGIGSRFTRQQFLSSALAEHARILVQHEPYCTFSVGSYELAGLSLGVSLGFYGEQLETIELFHDAKAFGSSWADWSEEKEQQRKQIHDQWLLALTGYASHFYAWGEIWSDFDPKSGGSSIVIRYSWQGKPWRRPWWQVTQS